MRRAARVDDNQAEIVAALRRIGATVVLLHAVGQGVPDLMVGYRGITYLLEVKDGGKIPSKQKLTADQKVFHAGWRGRPIAVVRNIGEALMAIGLTVAV